MTATKVEEPKHAKVSPSSVDRNLKCLASLIPIPEEKSVERFTSPYAEFGTQAHLAYELTMAGRPIPKMYTRKVNGKEDSDIFDEDAIKQGQDFVNVLRKVKSAVGTENIIASKVEAKVRISDLIYGTLDYCLIYKRGTNIRFYIADLKTGSGKGVAAFKNSQLMTYAIAAIGTYLKPAQIEKVDQVTIAIYQPNNQDESTQDLDQWVCRMSELHEFAGILRELETKAADIFENPMEAQRKLTELPGEHCQWCPRKPMCQGHARWASAPSLLMLGELDTPDLSPTVVDIEKGITPGLLVQSLDDTKIGLLLSKADIIRSFLKSVEEYAHARFESNKPIEGFKMVSGRSNRTWINDDEFIEEAFITRGLSPYKDTLLGIGEAEKLLQEQGMKADEIKKFMGTVTFKPTASKKIVSMDDPRPPIEGSLLSMLGVIE